MKKPIVIDIDRLIDAGLNFLVVATLVLGILAIGAMLDGM